MNYLYGYLPRVVGQFISFHPEIRNKALVTLAYLSSFTVRAESVFNRFNTLILTTGEPLSEILKENILKVRNSIPLSIEQMQTAESADEILDGIFTDLPEYWRLAVYWRWLNELRSDYRALFALRAQT